MRSLKLELEELKVESFATGASAGRGTVRAHDSDGGESDGCELEVGDGGGTKEVRSCFPTCGGGSCGSCPTGMYCCV